MARVLSRRAFLVEGALLSPLLMGAAGKSDLHIGQFVTGGAWDARPTGMRRLLWELTQRTSIEAHLDVVPLAPEAPALFRHPLLYWAGSGGFPALSEDGVRRLRRFVMYGGTLLVDSADADPGGAFDVSVRRDLARILPGNALARLPNDHVVYKSFYLVDTQAGRTIRVPYMEAVRLEKREAVIYSQNDLGGAWARDAFGRWEYPVSPGGERQREMAYRLGINILMYALCLDYKEDLVHAPFIKKRRR